MKGWKRKSRRKIQKRQRQREGGEQRERRRGREGGTFRRAYSIVSLQALPPVSGRRGRGRGCSLRRTATAAC